MNASLQHADFTNDLGLLHSALAYYWDNKAELDSDMQRRLDNVEKLRQSAGESALVKKLRTQGLIK